MEAGGAVTRDVDSSKVEALLSVATNARAMGFVTASTKANLDKPELTIAIKSDQGKEDQFIRGSGADGAARRYRPQRGHGETATIDSIVRAFNDIK
jgi:hypothetical protein